MKKIKVQKYEIKDFSTLIFICQIWQDGFDKFFFSIIIIMPPEMPCHEKLDEIKINLNDGNSFQ